jgi:hypothetical protein
MTRPRTPFIVAAAAAVALVAALIIIPQWLALDANGYDQAALRAKTRQHCDHAVRQIAQIGHHDTDPALPTWVDSCAEALFASIGPCIREYKAGTDSAGQCAERRATEGWQTWATKWAAESLPDPNAAAPGTIP